MDKNPNLKEVERHFLPAQIADYGRGIHAANLMKIVRNGVVYELSAKEVMEAYCEQEHKFDVEDVTDHLKLYSNCRAEYKNCANTLLTDPNALSEIAHQKRRNMDKYGMDWSDATEEAVDEAISALMSEHGS